jgi:V/A-type H+-transporting ATPase subunit A
MSNIKATGKVVYAFGNLVHIEFEGNVRQGEICYVQVKGKSLKAEVIEIENTIVKVQVFEDTSGISYNSPAIFTNELLEAELGPGLLTSIFDGLQNPLEKVAKEVGNYLQRGVYLPALDRAQKWEFTPTAQVGNSVKRGDFLGHTKEMRHLHQIMVPFTLYGHYKVQWIAPKGDYTIEETIAKLEDEQGQIVEVKMLQKWPVKFGLQEGKKVKPSEMMFTGSRSIDTQFPIF